MRAAPRQGRAVGAVRAIAQTVLAPSRLAIARTSLFLFAVEGMSVPHHALEITANVIAPV